VYANKWFLSAALMKLLSRGINFWMTTQMRWRMHEVSKSEAETED
jgi:hypothetical protein